MKKPEYEFTLCVENMKKWLKEVSNYNDGEGLSESDTRSKFIDSLFLNVLGWSDTEIKREDYVNKIGYYDYLLASSKSKFIIEAKKTDVKFPMPKDRTIKYGSLDSKSPLKKAIEQGINYAVTKKVNVVAVCNGQQIAVTYIPYTLIQSYNDTYLFRDLKDIKEKFNLIYNLFSPIQNIEDELPDLIVENKKNPILRPKPVFIEKINILQEDANAKLKSNELTRFFEEIHSLYFSEITHDTELLMKCYCDNTSVKKYEREIEQVLRDRAPLLDLPIEEVAIGKKSAGEFQQRLVANQNNPKLFLLLGGSGVGKTTFIHRFFNFIISEQDKQNIVWLYLNFKELSEEGRNIDDFVYEKIEEELSESEKYESLELFTDPEVQKKIFAKDLKKNRGNIELFPTEEEKVRERAKVIQKCKENKNLHIKRIFEYLRSHGFATCIVYDNVDQLNNALQVRLFKHANVFRETLKTTIILSLREEVYYEHQDDKILNYAEVELFHIPSPRFENVLSKRFKLLKEKIKPNEIFNVQSEPGAIIRVKKLDIIDVVTQTFLGVDENILMIEMLANGDLRDCLKYFNDIITSYNINFDPLLISAGVNATGQSVDKVIEYDELIRGLALKDRRHFDSSKSETLINLFEVENDGFYSHFTKIRILKYAHTRNHLRKGTLPTGFFKVKEMYEDSFIYSVNSLESFVGICKLLQKKGILINASGSINELNKDDYICLGASGKYYLNFLLFNPFYLSLVSVDTQLSSIKHQESISKNYDKSFNESNNLKKRRYIFMAREFIKYLHEEEEREKDYLLNTLKLASVEEDLFNCVKMIEDGFTSYIKQHNFLES
ncbi:MAG: hypothetical protein ACQEU4_12240 [Bacillota bacterium]